MTLAIEAEDLRKTYPPDVRALDGLSLAVQAGTIFGLLGPNGAGKSTTVRDPHHAVAPRQRRARVAGHRRARRSGRACAARSASSPRSTGSIPRRPAARTSSCRASSTRSPARDLQQRVADALERFGLAEAADRPGEDLLGRHAAPARPRDGPAPPPAGAVPRRADHGPRSGGARRDVARDRAARCRGADDDPADHPLPRGGRSAGLAAGDRRSRTDRRRRARPTSSRASFEGDAHPGRARRRPATPRARAALAARRRRRRRHARRPHAARPRAATARAAIPAVLAALDAQGVTAVAVTLARPSLDDVYLRHAGRAFRPRRRRARRGGGMTARPTDLAGQPALPARASSASPPTSASR